MNHHKTAADGPWHAASQTPRLNGADHPAPLDADFPLNSIGEMASVLRRGRGRILRWVLVCAALAGVYLYRAVPEFVATAQIVLEPRQTVVVGADLGSNALGPTLDSAQADSQTQVLKSERVLRYVFDTLDLVNDPAYRDAAPGPIALLLSGFMPEDPKLTPAERDAVIKAKAFQSFSDRVTVRRLGQSYVLEVSFRALSPADAARLANAITAAYIRAQVQFSAATAQRGTDFLQDRIANIKAELDIAAEAVRTGTIPDAQFADSDARVVSAAQMPLSKAYPQSTLIMLLAVVFGLLGGAGSVIARDKLDRTIRSRRQIWRAAGMDACTIVPRFVEIGARRGARRQLAYTTVSDGSTSDFVDALRVLRTAIFAADSTSRRLAIGIVSWLPGEGRSSIASNLAFTIGASRERVTLIDADFRKPSLSRALAPHAGLGLDEALLAHGEVTDPLAIALSDNVAVVPAVARGKASNPDVFLGSVEMRELLAALQSEQDIIVDLPPMSVSSDAQAIGHLLDGVILLVEANRTTIDDLNEAVRALRGAHTRLLGIVLNKTAPLARGRSRAQRRWFRRTQRV